MRKHIAPCSILSFDIETRGSEITCVGFAPDRSVALVIPFVDPRTETGSYWRSHDDEVAAWKFVRRTLAHPSRKLAQNGLYDIHFLWRQYGIKVRNFDEDTMLMHHALQPESEKGLGFLGSVYTNEPAWKLMRARGKTTIKRDE
jgi:DNA polymerase I-like protein with 3'-5' exonuclease and polymerase domains